jgi:AcrR family transcriptional regulator
MTPNGSLSNGIRLGLGKHMTADKTIKRAAGRPREFDKNTALKAALLLFWRQGYEGASIAQLTQAMKITAPSLYAAFGSKEQLYREVLELYMTAYLEPMARALGKPGSARDAVREMLMAAAMQFSRRGWPRGCLVANGALRCGQENQFAAQTTAAMRRMSQDAIRQRIGQAVIDGELAADTDTAALAAFYASVVQGMSVQAVDGATREQLIKLGQLAMAAWA